jgi:hypothetical protein
MTNERAEAWLRGLGFDPEPEPAWIERGRKPDFFARAASPLWVEVKTLAEDDFREQMGLAWDDLRARCAQARGSGGLHSLLGRFDERANKCTVSMAAALSARTHVGGAIYVIMIPGDPVYGTRHQIEYETESGERVVQLGPASESGRYTHYPSLEPRNWQVQTTLLHSPGESTTAPLFRHFGARIPFLLATRIFPDGEPLRSRSVGSGEARRVNIADRIRDVVGDANRQLRNGQSYAVAPGVVAIYDDHNAAPIGEMLLTALFGDLTVPVSRDGGDAGQAFFGQNGILRPDKTRGVSAVRYTGRHDAVSTVINPNAAHPIEPELFREPVWLLNGDRFELTHPANLGRLG